MLCTCTGKSPVRRSGLLGSSAIARLPFMSRAVASPVGTLFWAVGAKHHNIPVVCVCMCTCTVQALHSGRASHKARLLRHREAAVLQPGGGDRAPSLPFLRATTGVPSRRRPPPRWRRAGTRYTRCSFGGMRKHKARPHYSHKGPRVTVPSLRAGLGNPGPYKTMVELMS